MSAACSPPAAPSEFGETFADWASRLRLDSSRRQKSARAISASGSSSSGSTIGDLWRSPTAGTENSLRGGGQDPEIRKAQGHTINLKDQVVGFAKTWPTPRVGNNGGHGNGARAADPKNCRLEDTAAHWSTPRASDGEKGGPNQAFGAGGMPLPAQASQWMPPRSHEVGSYQYSKGDKSKPIPTLTGQAVSFLLDQGIFLAGSKLSIDGQVLPPSSDEILWPTPTTSVSDIDTMERNRSAGYVRQAQKEAGSPYLAQVSGVLNPAFVEWLMGWPIGWTASASSAMALCRWKRDMRSALSCLASPPAAPPPQLSLFA